MRSSFSGRKWHKNIKHKEIKLEKEVETTLVSTCQKDLQLDHLDPTTEKCRGLWPCTGFSWDRVKFLCGGLYGAMFWICTETSVDNRCHTR